MNVDRAIIISHKYFYFISVFSQKPLQFNPHVSRSKQINYEFFFDSCFASSRRARLKWGAGMSRLTWAPMPVSNLSIHRVYVFFMYVMWIQIIVYLSHRWMDQRALIAFHYFPGSPSMRPRRNQSTCFIYFSLFSSWHRNDTHETWRGGKIENFVI